MEITIQVDEFDIIYLHEGQPVQVTLIALPGRKFSGEVHSIDLKDQNKAGVATFAVTVIIPEAADIRPGMTAQVTIPLEERLDVLRVPSEAVTVGEDGKTGTVMVIGPEGPEARTVQIGLRTDRWTEVAGGLRPGERVVIASAERDIPTGFPLRRRPPMGP